MKLATCKSTLILAIVMLASLLAGCTSRSDDNQGGSPGSIAGGVSNSSEFVYTSKIIPFPELPDGKTDVVVVLLTDNSVYFTAWGDGDAQNTLNTHGLYSMDVDGGNFTLLPNYIPGGLQANEISGEIAIKTLHVDSEGNLWVSEYRDLQESDLPDGLSGSILRKLDKTGAEISAYDLSSLTTNRDSINVRAFNIDNEGNMYIASETNIYILDNQGNLIFSLDNPDSLANFVLQSDGAVMFPVRQESSVYLKKIDMERKSWGEIIGLPTEVPSVLSVFSSIGDYLYLYNDNSHLYGILAETGDLEKILSWADSSISSDDITSLMFLPDGRISAIRKTWRTGTPVTELLLLTKTSVDNVPEGIQLTLATFNFDSSIRYAVEQFNGNSTTHSIEVIDYSLFDTDEDPGAGLLRLSTEMISGKSPDILDIQSLPLSSYAPKGLLIDLYPFLDADPELDRNSIIESVLKASEVDGSLYHIIPSFELATIIGHPSVLGDYPGWNMDEFKAVLGANPQADIPIGFYGTNMMFLRLALWNNMDEYVDWTSGTAYFDSTDFIGLLETANTYPAEIDEYTSTYELVPTGRQIMDVTFFGRTDYLLNRVIFGGEIVIKGFPTENRNGNAFSPRTHIAITAHCADPNAAWEFVRLFLLEEYQREIIPDWSFPVNTVVFEQRLKEAMIPSSSITSVGSIDIELKDEKLSQEEVDALRDAINNTSRVWYSYGTLSKIINEEAAVFFNGQSTAQDAARIIQSRASIYLSEQN